MAALPFLVTASASFVAGGCFVAVAVALRRRRYSPDLRSAGQAYVLWWWMFAFEAFNDGVRVLLGLRDPVPVNLYVLFADLKILAAGVGIWALGRYVLFLVNGPRLAVVPLTLFAVAHALFFLWGVQAGLPAVIHIDTWSPRLVLTGPGTGLPSLGLVTLLAFFLPPILLSLAYLALIPRLETRTQRARVVAIACGILLFQVVGAIQFNPTTPANSPLFALLPLVNAAVGLVVLATYRPPAWMARRLRIEGLPAAAPRTAAPTGPPRTP